ncbi:MAG: DUF6647 family protein [Bradyrhizobium sp.]
MTPAAAAEPPASGTGAKQSSAEASAAAENLVGEISDWLTANFELPATQQRPAIRFLSQTELQDMRYRTTLDGSVQAEGEAAGQSRTASGVVALYDHTKRTIFLPEDWTGKGPAEQSALVHEMVHHLQNLAGLRFECPAAREKLAYKAQDRWLGRFGTDLETEFKLDPFSILMASACM